MNNPPKTFEALMSDFTKTVGEFERLPRGSIKADEDSRLQRQIERLIGVLQANRWGAGR